MTHAPDPSARLPDPGSPHLRPVLWAIVAVLMGLVIWQQQAGSSVSKVAGGPAPAAVAPDLPDPMAAGLARTMIRIGAALRASDPSAPVGQFVEALAQNAPTAADQIGVVIAAGELQDAAEARRRLAALDARTDLTDDLRADAAVLAKLYADPPGAIEDAERQRLIERHGRLGRIALTFGRGPSAERDELLGGGVQILVVVGFVVLFGIGALIASLILFPMAIAGVVSGRIRGAFVPPAPGGTVFVETFALFLAGFLGLKFLAGAFASLAAPDATWPIYATLGAQWLLVPILLWPMARGMTPSAWRSAVGLVPGRGVAREIVAGLVGYLALVPLYIGAVVVTALLVLARSLFTKDSTPPANPGLDLVSMGEPGLQVLLAFMAVCWAPLVEELLFRGGLHRHLRTRLPLLVVAPASAVLFALMHGYDVIIMLPVVALGVAFSLLREWRSSLIASMTAHALHNGVTVLLMIAGVNLLS